VYAKQGLKAGRQRRRHSAEFKARVVRESRQPGVSLAAVALANGLNANMLRRWVNEEGETAIAEVKPKALPPKGEFVALPLPVPTAPAAGEIRIELRCGAATVSVAWPLQAAGQCAAWLRDWLR
jgi:transposase-like protein